MCVRVCVRAYCNRATGEALAYGTLLAEGYDVRLWYVRQ
jgi:hypothetical protein